MTQAAKETSPEPLETEQPAAQQTELPEQTEADLLRERDEEIAKLKDMYLRAVAETENVRSRGRRENEDTQKFAITKFARDIVGVVETLARASDSVTPEARGSSDILKQVGEGLDMTMQEVLSIFARHGIRRISPLGEKFDHNFHQAVAQVESKDHPTGTVIQVLQAGYALHDRLLRPAMVTVSTEANAAKTDSSA